MLTQDRNPDHLYPLFRGKVELILSELAAWCTVHKPGFSPMLLEGFRTRARQMELYAQGRTASGGIVTEKNGTTNPSRHQSGLAADIAPARNGAVDWNDARFFGYLQHLAHLHGLTSGADWRTFIDLDHIEWPSIDGNTYAQAAQWKHRQGLV